MSYVLTAIISIVFGAGIMACFKVSGRCSEQERLEEAERGNEYFSVDENGIHIKAGRQSGANGGASTVVIDDSTSHITIGGGAGEQVKSIVKALRGLADALATLME